VAASPGCDFPPRPEETLAVVGDHDIGAGRTYVSGGWTGPAAVTPRLPTMSAAVAFISA
jgi:hypothetical protein